MKKISRLSVSLFFVIILGIALVTFLNHLHAQQTDDQKAFTMAEKAYEQGDYKNAIEFYKKALLKERYVDKSEIQILSSFDKLHQPEEKINFLKDRIETYHGDAFRQAFKYRRIADIYKNELKNNQLARVFYQKSIEKLVTPDALISLSEMDESKGNINSAIDFREKALSKMTIIDTETLARIKAADLAKLGNLYLQVNREADARRIFEEALKLNPKSREAQNGLEKLTNPKK